MTSPAPPPAERGFVGALHRGICPACLVALPLHQTKCQYRGLAADEIGVLVDAPVGGTHELHAGRWRLAVPLPLYLPFHVRCHCGERFWNWRGGKRRSWGTSLERYQWHYRRDHVPADPVVAAGGGGTENGDQ